MKTPLLLIACAYAMTSLGGNSIPNGSFESWKSRTFDYPEHYPYTSNSENRNDTTFNVTKTTMAYSGTYALKMVSTGKPGKDLKFGYCLNANANDGGPDEWKGGIPCNEKPTGIRGYFKYNVAVGDTALIIVTFSKAGNNIGTYFFPLTGVHTTYTLFEFPFAPALSVTPDSMILGFVSSNAIKETGLQGSELYIDNVSLTGVNAQPAQLNGDFESWNSQTTETIENWSVQNDNQTFCKKTADAKDGLYAIELQTYGGDENGVDVARPSVISTGYWDDNKGNWTGGIPFTYSIDTLAFSYKYTPTNPDGKAEISLQFKRNGNLYGYQSFNLNASANYQDMELPFNLYNMGTPDSVIITVQSTRWSDNQVSNIGSVLKMDNIHFKATGSSNPPNLDTEIQNGGFENWNSNSYDYPEFYPYNSNAEMLKNGSATFNVLKTNDAFHGSFAVKLFTSEPTSDNNFGYFLNSNPNNDNPGLWTGGIPINEKPTGIKGNFKYNVASGDSAMIIATFSKNGNNIGTYFLPLKGNHTTYADFDFTFSPALAQTPDSMILGFASSWIASKGLSGSELIIDNVSLTGVSAQPEKLNGDFESWSSNTIETPQKWNTDTPEACKKTNDAAAGSFALELSTYREENDGRPQARPGQISNGTWNDNSKKWEGGIAYNNTKNVLSFYYKYSPAQPTDSALVWLRFQMNGQEYNYQNIYLTATDVYKHVQIPLNSGYSMTTPDAIIIGFLSNQWSDTLTSHVGSVLKIDEIQFEEGQSYIKPSSDTEIQNGGFENWDSGSYDYPEFYPYNSNADMLKNGTATFNVLKTNDAFHGNFAVRLFTSESTSKDNFGYFLNGNPNNDNPGLWTGGIPLNEKPTGIKGNFKYNVASGDSAMIIATFSKNGNNIGSYFLPLKGNHASYTNFEFTFSPALAQTPDSMILGFASSWAMSESGLPGSELFIDNVSLTGVNAQPEKLNGDFESWNNNTIEKPQNWNTQNDNSDACKKTNDAAAGNFALELHTYLGDNDGRPQARPGVITNGTWNDSSNRWEGGISYSSIKNILSFTYKYSPAQPTDSAQIWLMFYMNGQPYGSQNIYLTATEVYKQVKFPLNFNFMNSPNAVVIGIQSNLWSDTLTSHVGSVLKIDEIQFKEEGGGGSGPETPVVSATVPNGSFEYWNSNTYDYPEFYPFNTNTNKLGSGAISNIFKTEDAFHGSYAVRLVTNPVNQNGINFGFFLNAQPNDQNPMSWTGGIPYNEKPTGIKGYYKYNQASADSAMILVTFSKQGHPLASYFYSLKGVKTSYTPFEFTFSPALTVTPDSMILGFASSFSGNQQGVPGSELFIDNVSLTGVITQPEKMNGDFESWSSSTLETPISWNYQNDNRDACKKTNDAAVGTLALELHTYLQNEDGRLRARPAEISTGYYNDNRDRWEGGSPFTNATDTLVFYYKYAPAQSSDSAQVSTQFKMNGESFWYCNAFLTASTEYRYAEIPIMIYHQYYRADSVIISIQSNLWSDSLTTHVGSVLKIDGFRFKSDKTQTGIVLAKNDTGTKLYPNPTNGKFTIQLFDKVIEKLDIYNLSGQKIISLGKSQIQANTEVDMTSYPRGIYLIKINDGSKSEVRKLILQ